VIHFKDIADDFLSLFLPRPCLSCGVSLVRGEEVLCTGCLLAMGRTDFHLQRGNMLEQAFWGRCKVERAAAFSVYNRGSRIRRLVHLLKYSGRKEIGTMLGGLYGTVLSESGFTDGIDMIIPVPLDPARERRRGYNQSMYIAGGMAKQCHLPVRDDILRRTGRSGSQTSRGRYERWENVEGLFAIRAPGEITGKHLLLVDDVITTGSTVEACVTALRSAEDVRVSVAALAVARKLTV
jgi:ComF family protein